MQGNPPPKPLSRLGHMRRLSTSLLALALGAAAAVALVSCGDEGDADLLPGGTASEINANLDQVRDLAESGDCAGAQSAAQQVSDQIAALGGVDRRLKQALREGATKLNEVVAECVETTTEAIAPASIPAPDESTKEERKQAKEEAKDIAKEEKEQADQDEGERPEEPAAPETPPANAPPETTPPGQGGGTGAPGGVGPGSEVDGDGE